MGIIDIAFPIYRISGNIDSDFNLAIWRIAFSVVKLKFVITYNLPLAIQALMLIEGLIANSLFYLHSPNIMFTKYSVYAVYYTDSYCPI